MTTHHSTRGARSTLALAAVLGLVTPGPVHAGGTRTFRVADFDDFDSGETEGAAIQASGRVTAGLLPARADVPGAAAFTCLADGKDGKLAFVGTADAATIRRVRVDAGKPAKKGDAAPPTVQKLAELKGAVAAALAQLPNGDLLAATLPGGKIVRVDAKGAVTPFPSSRSNRSGRSSPTKIACSSAPDTRASGSPSTCPARTSRSSSTATRRTYSPSSPSARTSSSDPHARTRSSRSGKDRIGIARRMIDVVW